MVKFLLTADHHHFFLQKHHITFDDLLLPTEAENLKEALQNALAKRLKIPLSQVQHAKTEDLYRAGHDLWREDPFIKKIVVSRRLSEIASPLFSCSPLRLAYDQYVGTTKDLLSPLSTAFNLQQMSSIQKVVGGLLLILSSPILSADSILPSKIGSGIFFSPKVPILWKEIYSAKNLSALLIVYCQEKSLYTLEKQDYHTHALKQFGYVFGDHITNATHPILLRE